MFLIILSLFYSFIFHPLLTIDNFQSYNIELFTSSISIYYLFMV